MVALPHNFNTADVEDSAYDPLPPNTYEAMITESEMKATKGGDGAYIQLTLQITKGDKAGRNLTERLNIQNKNQTAMDIAYRTLKAICLAVGKTNIADTNELHNKRFNVVVEVEKGKPYTNAAGEQKDGNMQNVIKKYLPVNAAQSASETPASTASAPTAPWKKKTA